MKLEYEREEEEDNKRENQLLDWTTMKIGNAFGKKWISMTNEEKVKYYDIASEKRIEFDRAMAEFNNKMVPWTNLELLQTVCIHQAQFPVNSQVPVKNSKGERHHNGKSSKKEEKKCKHVHIPIFLYLDPLPKLFKFAVWHWNLNKKLSKER
ncbi:hypothetical protein GLYMA_08G190500v4 [Glycine max]|uniref:HMG box domain-containing protein n=2 Tax=Glycine subgen. Soja TaxID=1462606 RepID=K7L7K1_SOYBN|nr:uncharacterized protein LOC100820624 isoform X1 [Glycine max]XP_028244373.1 uncharacterized protein LOC114422286 isoform X1 [Glycine soja]KAG5000645.1 hypothetical protein JHK87_021717 [Glycine soja]KRH44111.1 hypothetical protein GLYMA_08G190500v4 [Glycine max]RZB97690.1 hypothetical protein D0Y65_020994 [Glycine soja]|eukprot:XP_014634589.1 uncharacterized protein LOC100820624 isoform X1 [Glycine max]